MTLLKHELFLLLQCFKTVFPVEHQKTVKHKTVFFFLSFFMSLLTFWQTMRNIKGYHEFFILFFVSNGLLNCYREFLEENKFWKLFSEIKSTDFRLLWNTKLEYICVISFGQRFKLKIYGSYRMNNELYN